MDLPPRPTLYDLQGVSMVRCFTNNWENTQHFEARPEDILVAAYAKAAGTMWASYILDLLFFGGTHPDRQNSIPLHERVPFLEISRPSPPTGLWTRNRPALLLPQLVCFS
uniref:Sulfotransferase n=1 Tax=Nothobranchius furzeri TaxID=105023 RepID=A0A1A8UUK4_NOTFU